MKEANVLIVDDDEVDVEALRRSFKRRKIANPIYVASDGIEALEVLRGKEGVQRIPRPYLILLDINMPRMNGLEFLRELRADSELKDIVVFVLTTSSDQNDVFEAYDLNVAGYILKSAAGDSFLKVIDLIDHYWKVVLLK